LLKGTKTYQVINLLKEIIEAIFDFNKSFGCSSNDLFFVSA